MATKGKPAVRDCDIESHSLPRATCPICPVHGGGRDFTCLNDLVRTGCGYTHGDKHKKLMRVNDAESFNQPKLALKATPKEDLISLCIHTSKIMRLIRKWSGGKSIKPWSLLTMSWSFRVCVISINAINTKSVTWAIKKMIEMRTEQVRWTVGKQKILMSSSSHIPLKRTKPTTSNN